MSGAPAKSSRPPIDGSRWHRLGARLQAALLALACAACATPAPVHFHSLVGPAHPSMREGLTPGRGPAMSLDPIRVPVAVDQPQWLIRLPDETLTLLEQERWAGPLRDEFRHALLDVLTHRYGAVDARTVGTGGSPWRVHIVITRFDAQPSSSWLESTWSIGKRDSETPTLRCETSVRETSDGGMPALAQAHRRAVMRLGDAIGEQLIALQRGEPGRCSG